MLPIKPFCHIFPILFSIPVTFLFSCRHDDSSLQRVLQKAGNNPPVLQQVLDHYKNANTDKKRAAYFLIENMDTHFLFLSVFYHDTNCSTCIGILPKKKSTAVWKGNTGNPCEETLYYRFPYCK
jgi:hypothetical protein